MWDFTWRVSDCEELVGGWDDKELNANPKPDSNQRPDD